MTSSSKKLLMFLLFLGLFLPGAVVKADTGPKPTMEFEFVQPSVGGPLTIVSGILYECQQSDCSDAQPLEEVGPQGFRCSPEGCDALAYGFSPYHRIEIKFSDGKTRQSNIFETAGFDSRYKVTIQPNGLLVESQFSSPVSPWTATLLVLCACLLCGGILLIALIVFLIRRLSRK